jgi:polar amino acid transport system substrate-binding protein
MKLLITIFSIFTVTLFAQNYTIVTTPFPPYQIYKNNKLSGISVDLINEIQRRAETKYPIEVLESEKAYAKTLDNENYIILSIGKTIARSNNLQWVGPIGTLKYVFFKNNINKHTIKTLYNAKQVDGILVSKDDIAHQVLLRLNFQNLIIVNDASSDKNIRTFTNLDKDIFWAADEKNGLYKIKHLGLEKKIKPIMTNKPISKSTLYIAFNKKADQKLVQRWREILNEIKKDGTYQRIIRKYL